MNLQQYRDQNQKVKPNADVNERWETRVRKHHLSGAQGAQAYIGRWGAGWGVKKALMFARDEGRSLGSIGTGYSREDQREILRRFQAGNARCLIRCQGFTENNIVWHGRFIGWAE